MSLLTLLGVDPVELTGFVRRQVDANPHFLEQILPTERVANIDVAMKRGATRRGNVAKFRAYDTPAPIGKRQPVTEIRGSLPPISQKISLGEEELLRLAALRQGETDTELIDQVYDDGRNMGLSIADRFELARGEALTTGKIVIAENDIVGVTVDFGRAGGHTVTAGTLWSTVSTATPITNLQAWTRTYKAANNGTLPGAWLTSQSVVDYLVRNVQIQGLLVNQLGINPAILTEDQLATILRINGIAPIVVDDDEFYVDDVATRPIPVNKIVAVPPAGQGLGKTFWAATAESAFLAASQQVTIAEAPGIVTTVHESEDPVAVWTKAAAIGLPFIPNPDLTFAATVA